MARTPVRADSREQCGAPVVYPPLAEIPHWCSRPAGHVGRDHWCDAQIEAWAASLPRLVDMSSEKRARLSVLFAPARQVRGKP